ncbi:MAG: hypothetical protein EPO67_04010 [Reyranella sp.]|nr:MAG: hypothetical protein EPO67_04010 [Reyranella sp.]
MIRYLKWVAVPAAAFAMAGCDLATVATTPSSEYSAKSGGTDKLEMALIYSDGRRTGNIPSEKWQGLSEDAKAALQANCSPPQRPTQTDTIQPAMAPVAAGIIVALAGMLIDAGVAQAKDYVKKKAEEFKAEYAFKVNVDSLALPPGARDRYLKCLVVQRQTEFDDANVKLPVHQAYRDELRAGGSGNSKIFLPAMTLGLVLSPKGNAYVMKPIFIDMNYSAARTFKEDNKVNLAVSVGINVLQAGQGQQTTRLLTLQNYTIQGVELPNVQTLPKGEPGSPEYQSTRKVTKRDQQGNVIGYEDRPTAHGALIVETKDVRKPYDRSKFAEGTIMPPLDAAVPATIVVSVVEQGEGAKAFEGAGKDLDAVSGAAKSLGLEQLKKALGAE